jgi:hypothetical protein
MSNIFGSKGNRPSRRSFLTRIGELVGGLAVAVVGGSLSIRQALAEANVNPASVPLECCSGVPCSQSGCPSGSEVTYIWICDQGQNGSYYCNDCYSGGTYKCTYPTTYVKG